MLQPAPCTYEEYNITERRPSLRHLPVVHLGGITQRAGDVISFGFIGIS